MKKFVSAVIGAILALILFVPPVTTNALSTASFVTTPAPVDQVMTVGTTYTFDSTNLVQCDTAPPPPAYQGSGCSYTWYGTYPTYGGGTNYLVQLGRGLKATWVATDFAASKPYISIILKVTSSNSTHRYVITGQRFVVKSVLP